MRLKSKLLSLNASLPAASKVKVFSPRNCEELRIPFKADKIAKVVGRLADISPAAGLSSAEQDDAKIISGVLVENDFKLSLMAADDLREYAGLTTTIVNCKQRLRLSAAGIDLIKWGLESTFGNIELLPTNAPHKPETNGDTHMNGIDPEAVDDEVERGVETKYLVMGCITVSHKDNGEVDLEWEGNILNDGIADAVMAVLMSVESSPAAVKQSSSKQSHDHTNSDLPKSNPHATLDPAERLARLFMFLEAQFGADALTPIESPKRLPMLVKVSNEEHIVEAEDEEEVKVQQASELERLHKLGVPVPGIAIRVDKMEAKVWLEDLEVESTTKAFGERVRAIVERAVEVIAPLWG